MSTEIIIDNPEANKDKLRSYTYNDPRFFIEGLELTPVVTPENFPIVADLCAGAGSISAILASRGWKPENLFCFDHAKSDFVLADGLNWNYWDLEALSRKLNSKAELPAEVMKFYQKFDLTFMIQGFTLLPTETLCRFFTKPGGMAYTSSYFLSSVNPKVWENYRGFNLKIS